MGISPFLDLKSHFKLLFSKLQDQCELVFLVKLDRMRDSAVEVRLLVVLDDLIEMRMECLRDSSVLSLALVLSAKVKHFLSCLVVKDKELAV